jgi:hypothetical protein
MRIENNSQFRQGRVGEWLHRVPDFPLPAKSKNRNPPPLFRKAPYSSSADKWHFTAKKIQAGVLCPF